MLGVFERCLNQLFASFYSFHKTFVGMRGSHLGNMVSSCLMSIRTASVEKG